MFEVTDGQKRALGVTTALAIVLGFYFVNVYLLLIAFAAIVAFIFNPVYQHFLKKWGKAGKASAVTFFISLLAMIIPIGIVVTITVFQVAHLAENISNGINNVDLNTLIQHLVDGVNNFLSGLGVTYRLTVEGVISGLSEALKTFGSSIVSGIASSISGFIDWITLFIIYIYVFLSMLTKQDKILEVVHQLNPLGKDISHLYTDRIAAMTKAMVRGQFIIATAQGFADAAFLYLAGLHSAFFFFFLLLTALSIIPLGGGIVAIPIGIIMLFTGNIMGGILVLFGHFVVVTNIDNIMRPKLVPKQARLDPALTLLAVFSGLHFFGFLGIILGPVLMIVIVTTIQIYLQVFKGLDEVDTSKITKPKSLLSRISGLWKKPEPTEPKFVSAPKSPVTKKDRKS